MADRPHWRKQSRAGSLGDPLQLCACPAGLWHVAGALWVSLSHWPVDVYSCDAKRANQHWHSMAGKATVDIARSFRPRRPSDRNGLLDPGVRRVPCHYARSGRRRCPAAADARLPALGIGLADCLAGVDVADVSAYGNARHRDDEWIGMTGKRSRIEWMIVAIVLFSLPVSAH